MGVLDLITQRIGRGEKHVAVLVDPDRLTADHLDAIARHHRHIGLVLVGGSFTVEPIGAAVARLKARVEVPTVLFPGDATQVCAEADALLMLSLISGRNPEFLIGQQLLAAPRILEYGLEALPTGYILIDGGKQTAVSYVSNTTAIPADQHDIVVGTALAGKYLGLRLIYLETGSGAPRSVPPELVRKVKSTVGLPLIVGGGIRAIEQLDALFDAGADIAVIGTLFEDSPDALGEVVGRRRGGTTDRGTAGDPAPAH